MHRTNRKLFQIIAWKKKICTFPFFPGSPPAAVGDIKTNSASWAERGLWVWSHDYSSCKYLFVLGLAIFFVYCMKFLFPSWSPALTINEVCARSAPLPFVCVCVHACVHTRVYESPFLCWIELVFHCSTQTLICSAKQVYLGKWGLEA